ncbi:MAG: peroxiredoxin [Actinomycetota bacterium]|nr:peroxiredoxin [Actinomycetota bacterium]
MTHDPMALPADLPAPADDRAASHLPGYAVPAISLPATTGETVDLSTASQGRRLVVFAYPRTGVPGEDPLTPDWDAIPGARGCTPELCSVRDVHADFVAAGVEVYGLSTQDGAYQREAAERLHLSYPLLSDAGFDLGAAMDLPSFSAAGQVLYCRLTMVIEDGVVRHVWYPVFPPHTHAGEVLAWLRRTPL